VPGLVIQLIGDQRATLAVIVIVPAIDLLCRAVTSIKAFSSEVRALLCMGVQAGENQQTGENRRRLNIVSVLAHGGV
jgi:hypothetical protein